MSRPLPSGSNELPSKFGGVSALEYICKSRTLVSLRFSIPSASHTHLAFRASRYSPKAYGKSLSTFIPTPNKSIEGYRQFVKGQIEEL